MDALLFNIIGETPIVTKVWLCGILAMSVLSTTTMVDSTKTLYNFDLVFKKGQFMRILYSLFDYGEFDWFYFLNVVCLMQQLAALETTIPERSRFLWMVCIMGGFIISASKWIQPVESLARILHKNLAYYKLRREIQDLPGAPNPFLAPALVTRVGIDVFMVCKLGQSAGSVLLTYAAGHTFFFLEQLVSKIYNVDLCCPPNKWFVTRGGTGNQEEAHEPLEE